MKKISLRMLALALSTVLIFSLGACGGTENSSSDIETGDQQGVLIGIGDEENVGGTDSQGSGQNGTDNGQAGNNNNNNTSAPTVSEPVELDDKDPFASIPSNLKNTTVTFAHFGDEGASEYQKVIKAFTKDTGIKVNLVSYNQEDYVSTVAKQIAAKAGPDVIICNEAFPSALEIAQPLQNIVDLDDDFWDDEITELSTVGGNTYFVNSLESVWENIDMVFYNKTLFSNNGLTTPTDYYESGKWTYENLKKCLEQITKLGYIGGYMDADKLSASMGVPLISYDPKTNKFTNNITKMSAAYQFAAQIQKEGLWSTTAWWGTFSNGTIGIYTSGLYGAKYNGFFKDMDNNSIAAVPMPTSFQGKELKPTSGMRAYGIAKGAKNPMGAVYFLRYFLDYSYYKPAGANVFKNSSLEKVYFDEIIPLIKEKGRNFDLSYDPMCLADNSNIGLFMTDVRTADPSQVPSVLASKSNIVQNGVDKANEKLASYK